MSPRCFRAGTFFGLSRSVTFAATQRLDHVERRREPRLHLRQRSHLRIAQGVDFAQRLLTLSGERARCALEVHGHRRRIPRVVTLPAVGLALHVISIVLPGRVRHWEENAARVDDAGTVEPHDRDDLIGSRISLRILQDHSAGHQGRRVGGTGPDDLVAPDRDARRRLLALRDPGHVEILATPVGRVRYVDRDVGQLLVFAQPRAVLGEDGVRVDELVAPVHLRRVADEVADQPIRADLSFGEDLLRAFGLRSLEREHVPLVANLLSIGRDDLFLERDLVARYRDLESLVIFREVCLRRVERTLRRRLVGFRFVAACEDCQGDRCDSEKSHDSPSGSLARDVTPRFAFLGIWLARNIAEFSDFVKKQRVIKIRE